MANPDHVIDQRAIKERILESQALIPEYVRDTCDFPSLKANMLLRELELEVAILLNLLENPDDFARAFKDRYALRERRTDSILPMRDYLDTVTNQLYWDIGVIVFKPEMLKDMLAVALPSLKQQISVSIPDKMPTAPATPSALNLAATSLEPILEVSELEHLTGPCTLKELSYYVLADHQIFDVREISRLPLGTHLNLHQALTQRYPAVADNLYTHNTFLSLLNEDIQTIRNNGRTPRDALTRLMKQLELGGSNMNGSEFASESAIMEANVFLHFLEIIPKETYDQLKKLKATTATSLEDVFYEISKGNCVQTTASMIKRILEANPNEPLLNTPIKTLNLKPLYKRYSSTNSEQGRLAAAKDTPVTFHFPEQLLSQSIKTIHIENTEDLILLLVNFSTTHYDMLWANMHSDIPAKLLGDAATIIADDLLSPEQVNALGKAIMKHFARYDASLDRVSWALKTNKAELYIEALKTLSVNELHELITDCNLSNETLLHSVADKPALLQATLQIFPKDTLLNALEAKKLSGYSPLHQAAQNPASLKVFISHFSEKVIARIALSQCNLGNNVLHCAARHPESLRIILECIPEPMHAQAIHALTHDGNSVLHVAASTPDSLRILLDKIPPNQRLERISETNDRNESVLHISTANIECLQITLDIHPKDQQLAAILTPSADGFNALHFGISNPSALRFLLEIIPDKQRFEVVTGGQYPQKGLMPKASYSMDAIRVILEALNANQRLEMLLTTNENNTPILARAAQNIALLNVMLELLPPHQHHDAIRQKFPDGKTMLLLSAPLDEVLVKVLSYYSSEEIIDAINLKANSNDTLLFQASSNLRSLQLLFAHYPKERLPELVMDSRNSSDETLLHQAIHVPQRFKFLFKKIAPEKRLSFISKRRGNPGESLLFEMVRRGTSFITMFGLLPEQDRFKALKFEENNNNMLLHSIVNNNASISILEILELLPETERLPAMRLADKNGDTTFQLLRIYESTPIIRILAFYPEDERLSLIESHSTNRAPILFRIAHHPHYLKEVLKLYNENDLLRILNIKSPFGSRTLLDAVSTNATSTRMLMERLRQDQTLEKYISSSDSLMETARVMAQATPPSFKVLFEYLTGDQRFELIMGKTYLHTLLLHTIAEAPKNNLVSFIYQHLSLKKQLEASFTLDEDGDTLLHCTTHNTALFKSILNLLPRDQWLKTIRIANKKGETVLHLAKANPELLQFILEIYPEKQRLPAVRALTTEKMNVLYYAKHTQKSLQTILSLYPEEQRFSAVTPKSKNRQIFTNNFNELYSILKLLPKQRRLEALQYALDNCNSFQLFQRIGSNLKYLLAILRLLNKRQKRQLLYLKDKDGYYLLHHTASCAQCLKKLLSLYPKTARTNIILTPTNEGLTTLDMAVKTRDSLQIVFELLPPEERLYAISFTTIKGLSGFHYAVLNAHYLSVKFILSQFSPKIRRELITSFTRRDMTETALHLAIPNSQCLALLLKNMPANSIYQLITAPDDKQTTLFHRAAKCELSLKVIFSYLSQEERKAALELTNSEGLKPLQLAASNHPSLQVILSQYPREQHQSLLKSSSSDGTPTIFFTASSEFSWTNALKLIPENERLALVTSRLPTGNILLNSAVHERPSALREALILLPKAHRLTAVTCHTDSCKPIIQAFVMNKYMLNSIFDALPDSCHADAMMAENDIGETLLHYAATCESAIDVCSKYLTDKNRAKIINLRTMHGDTPLHKAATEPLFMFKKMLELYPEEHRKEAVLARNNANESALTLTIGNLSSFIIALTHIPFDNRLTVLTNTDNHSGYSLLEVAAQNSNTLLVVYKLTFGEDACSILKPWLDGYVSGLVGLLNDNLGFPDHIINNAHPGLFKPVSDTSTDATNPVIKLSDLINKPDDPVPEQDMTPGAELKALALKHNRIRVYVSEFISEHKEDRYSRLAKAIRKFEKEYHLTLNNQTLQTARGTRYGQP